MGEVVEAPLANAQCAGTLVVAPVAPEKGPIPPGQTAVVVTVKEWWQLPELWITRLLTYGCVVSGLDGVADALIPLLTTDTEINWHALGRTLARAFVGGMVSHYVSHRIRTSNVVVR